MAVQSPWRVPYILAVIPDAYVEHLEATSFVAAEWRTWQRIVPDRSIATSSALGEALEFDRVIVPDASARNYHTDMDRNLLYDPCTRAMHRLTIVAVGAPSDLLPASFTH